jgi:hypothetical protein
MNDRHRYNHVDPAADAASQRPVSITAAPSPLAAWLAGVLSAVVLILPAAAHAHVAGCHTRKCDRRIHAKRAAHWCRTHPSCVWRHRWARIDAGLKARLARLRYCESTNNYRAVNGQYTGAYQYAASTWARAGGSGLAMNAPPREQDVRTAWFFPSHAGEWECRA